jgi:Ca2+:H+ antiporter
LSKKEKIIIVLAFGVSVLTGILHYSNSTKLIVFIISAISISLLAKIVGDATEQLGSRTGPGVTGILQSALGNLPELFICIFALRAGLYNVVQAALIGSILGNSLLVFGLALFIGGLKNGKQAFSSEQPKMIVTLMILAFSALAIPTLAKELHTAADTHLNSLNIVLAIILLLLFIAGLIYFIKEDKSIIPKQNENHPKEIKWSLGLSITILGVSGLAAAFVSDWFVDALQPAMTSLGINEVFAGLVIVAVASNAIENVVGIELAYRNKTNYSVSVILNSSLQIALCLFPLLVLLSFVIGGSILSFVLTPLLLASLALAVLVNTVIVFDGESIWLEGLALIGLYCLIAAAFWWG